MNRERAEEHLAHNERGKESERARQSRSDEQGEEHSILFPEGRAGDKGEALQPDYFLPLGDASAIDSSAFTAEEMVRARFLTF